MTSVPVSRRAFSVAAGALASGFAASARAATSDDLGISNGHKAIHQVVVFKATPARVYRVLTDAELFDKVVLFSGAIPAMQLKASPARISPDEGGAFALFGGYITGRNVELTPGVRVIQAWRAGSWAPHILSIVRFELVAQAGGCRLVFDHTGFPNEEAVSLATGWQAHYWGPMAEVLA